VWSFLSKSSTVTLYFTGNEAMTAVFFLFQSLYADDDEFHKRGVE
jgi:hypothetical protein